MENEMIEAKLHIAVRVFNMRDQSDRDQK